MVGALKFRLSLSLVCSHYRVLVKHKNCALPMIVSMDSFLTHMDSKGQLMIRKDRDDGSAK